MIIIITLQQLFNIFIIRFTVFKLGFAIYSNVLKEVSSQQGCIYLYINKNTCLIQEGVSKMATNWALFGMSDRMLKKVVLYLTVLSKYFKTLYL